MTGWQGGEEEKNSKESSEQKNTFSHRCKDRKEIGGEPLNKDDIQSKYVLEGERETSPIIRKPSLDKKNFVSTGTIEEDLSLEEQIDNKCFPRNFLKGGGGGGAGCGGGGGGDKEKQKWSDLQIVNLDEGGADVLTDVERLSMDLKKSQNVCIFQVVHGLDQDEVLGT